MHEIKLFRDSSPGGEFSIFEPLINASMQEEYTEPEGLEVIYISVFDHWLSEEEAEQQIVPYVVITDKLHKKTYSVDKTIEMVSSYYQNESKLLAWYILLYKSFKVAFFDKKKNSFAYFRNLENFVELCQKSIREEALLDIYIPECQCALLGKYDFTLPLYYKEESRLSNMLDLAQACGLHVLK